MPKQGKRYRSDIQKVDKDRNYTLDEAVSFVKTFKPTKFDQSVELVMHLGIDPRQADQALRGAIALPHGIGATKRVVAFCTEDKIAACKEAGAIEAGGDDLAEKISGGWMDFDVAVAQPEMMRVVGKLGRVLGPKGLMPSPKSGTVAADVVKAVKEYGAGKLEYRNDSGGNVQVVVGKMSFDSNQLVENARHFIQHIVRIKPSTSKGIYVKKVSLSGTMTPGVSVDPSNTAAAEVNPDEE